MRALRLGLLSASFALGACATVEEPVTPPAPESEPPPPVAVEKPPPAPKIEPPPAPAPAPIAAPAPRISEVEALVLDFERLRRLSPGELAREQEAARQAFNQSRSDAARVRLAMAVAMPGTAASEDARALELLEPLVKNPSAGLRGLAVLLSAYIQEQRRLAVQVQGLQQNVQGLQQNLVGLQQKLDALKTLERSLSERGEGAPRRR